MHQPSIHRRQLDLDRPIYARRTFTSRGHTFVAHEVMDWQGQRVSESTMARWFRQRMITHHRDGDHGVVMTHSQKLAREREIRKAPPTDEEGLRLDGPTVEEYVKAGYDERAYPPLGYRIRKSPGLTLLQNKLLDMDQKDWKPKDLAIITADPVE